MRKILPKYIPLFILLFIIAIGFHPRLVIAKAETYNTEKGLEETIKEQLGELDLKELDAYLQSLDEFNQQPLAQRLLAYIKGGEIDYESFWRSLVRVIFAKITELLPAFACIMAITLLSGMLSTMHSSTAGQTSLDMTFIITYAAVLIPLLSIVIEVFSGCLAGIRSMQKQMQLLYPLMLTLLSVSGGTISASVCQPAVAFFSSTIVSAMEGVVFPLTITIILFSMSSKLTKELNLGKFTAFFKSMNKWIIGICVSAFGIFFTLQGITAATYDGVVRRTAKYAISNGVPIVGGFLSGGFDLAVAGGILIKNSLGTMGIFLLIAVLFEPIVLLISVNLLLRLTSAITQPFGEGRIADFLGETAENLQYCGAGLLFTAFLYFLSIMIMIFSTEALL